VNKFKRHLTVANVLSLTALFVALGGSAYAATKLGVGQVKAVNIAKQAVTNPKIKTQAVTSGKIKNLGVFAQDLGTGSVITSKIAKNAVNNSKLGKEAVGANKIKANAVTEEKIAKEAVGRAKIGYEAVDASKISSSLYAQLVRNVSYYNSISVTNNEANKTATVECPSGKQAVGGGVRLEGELKNVATTASYPYYNGSAHNGWTAIAHESGEGPFGDWSIVAFAVCAEL